MPYFGLLDEELREISGKGYKRLDMADYLFKISPPRDAGDDLTIVNYDSVKWKAGKTWSSVAYIAIYDEIDTIFPLCYAPFGQLPPLRRGGVVMMWPGQWSLSTSIKKDRDGLAKRTPRTPVPGKLVKV